MAKSKKQMPKQKKTELPDTKATAKKISRRTQKQIKEREKEKQMKWEFPLSRKNMQIMGIGLGVIIIGYLLIATGMTEEPAVPNGTWNNPFAVIIAPILLVIGYLVIIPYGIMKVFDKQNSDKTSNQ